MHSLCECTIIGDYLYNNVVELTRAALKCNCKSCHKHFIKIQNLESNRILTGAEKRNPKPNIATMLIS